MEKSKLLTIAFLLLFQITSLVVESANANFSPSMFKGELKNAPAPKLTVYSPQNQIYASNNLTLYLRAEIGDLPQESVFGQVGISEIYLESDWIANSVAIKTNNTYKDVMSHVPLYPVNATYSLIDIPDGNHSLRITAVETGMAGWNENTGAAAYDINVNASVTVNFAIDTEPPKIEILSIGNKTYGTTELSLEFNINEMPSQIWYNLDNTGNTAIDGNTTLSNLTYGSHSLILYANDTVGNTGTTENIDFTISKSKPFPWLLVAAVSVGVAAVVSVAAMIYLKKREQGVRT
jgi:hypothetical protein